ncbi:MAG: stage V sporulation protein AD [Clostridia bacterium]|nr:stage V sporulation protein AD [Clostridia bacterium]
MSSTRIGSQTIKFSAPPSVIGSAAVAGKKEGRGPLKHTFDFISNDSYFGEASWEKAESAMLKQCFSIACDKAKLPPSSLDLIFSGDLLNQCTGSAYALRDAGVPYFGLYGACSTMAESLALSAISIDGGCANAAAALTSSHFCSAERQFRFPLEYGSVRSPTAQWTVTAAGAVILGAQGQGPYITHATVGKIVDAGIADAGNMGAAMAPAAYDTLTAHFADTGRTPGYYDAIVTGDLGSLGRDIVRDLMRDDGIDLAERYMDCGVLIFDTKAQDTHAGGSGCGCCASVLAGHLLRGMKNGVWKKLLFAATGALMSPTTALQGESIPGICHALAIESERC